MRSLVLISQMWLTSCGTDASRSVTVVCPMIVEYTPAFQMRAADEVQKLPEGSAVLTLVEDYGQLRDRIRACR